MHRSVFYAHIFSELMRASALHLLAQKSGDRGGELDLHLCGGIGCRARNKHHAAHDIALGYDGGGYRNIVLVASANKGNAGRFGGGIQLTAVENVGKLIADGLIDKLLLWNACAGDNTVSVANGGDAVAGFVERVADLRGEVGQLSDGGVFFENYLAVLFGVNLQRVAVAYAQSAADFLRDDDAAEVVSTCQERGKKFGRRSKPLK